MRCSLVLAICLAVFAAAKPPPSETSNRYESKPPPSDRYESKPPPSDRYESKPPPSDRYESKPPPSDRTDSIPPIAPRASDIDCGTHSLADGTYYIESPNYPNNYPNYQDCTYSITAQSGGPVQFACEAFNLEYNSQCSWDWFMVNGQKYCGQTAPPSISQNSIDIEFHTDYSVTRSGFRCYFSIGGGGGGNSNLDCGTHELSRGSYIIKSINYPQNYVNYHDCNYALSAENSADRLTITCAAFNVEQNSACSWDWLSVNGQKYCGTTGPDTSSTGSMNIEFHTDYSVVRSGFSCTVEVVEETGTTTTTTSAPPSGSCCCGMPNRASRIVGGVETEVNEYPWQVGLVSTGETRTWCGGTLINNMYVLTAAHCTQTTPSQIEVLLKEHRINDASDNEIRASVSQIINHPSYTSASGSGYDFSLLKLSQPVTFPADNSLAPACLPTSSSGDFTGVDAIVSGWGTTSSGGSQATTLQEVTVPVISNAACSSSYNSINPTMICAGLSQGGKDSCQGDSGGPMVTLENDRYSVIGVVSWGRGCALAGYPGVYARVTSVLTWIQQNTADGTFCS